jgi:serine/threonine protein kinase
MENGSLADILQKFGSFPEELVSKYSYQVLSGLDYLHNDKNILHGDIKGANILITKNGICKLADFGVSMKIEPDKPQGTVTGSPYWSLSFFFVSADEF